MENNIAENAMNSLVEEINRLYSPTNKQQKVIEQTLTDSENKTIGVHEIEQNTSSQRETIDRLESYSLHLESLIEQLRLEKQQFESEMKKLQRKANRAETLEARVARLKKKLEDNNIPLQGKPSGTSTKQKRTTVEE